MGSLHQIAQYYVEYIKDKENKGVLSTRGRTEERT
jgi:hypothetical protein